MSSGQSIKKTIDEGVEFSKRFNKKMREEGEELYSALQNILALTFISLTLAVIFNLVGWGDVNIVLSFVALIAGIMIFIHPKILITIANIDIINRALPEKLQMTAVDALFDTFIRAAKRLVALCCMIFLFLGIVPIGDNLKIFGVGFMFLIIFILYETNDKVAQNRTERGKN